MANPDEGPSQASSAADEATSGAAADAHAGDVVNHDAFHLDLDAGPVLAEILASPSVPLEAGLDDLQATLTSMSHDVIEHLDIAAQHLTHAIDLFDVPLGLDTHGSHDAS